MIALRTIVLVLVLSMAGAVFAQNASRGRGARGAPPPQAKPVAAADLAERTGKLIEPSGFVYNPDGRRDPFVSLLRRGADAGNAPPGSRPAGIAGLGVSEVTLRGTMRGREGFVGLVQGADQKTYLVRTGDRLLDGTVRMISPTDMVIVQQVNDPLSLEKEREVRKVLRQTEVRN